MLLEELCRIITDGYESTDSLVVEVRQFLRNVDEKHKEVLAKRDKASLEKWSKKLVQIALMVKMFPMEFQLALETSMHTKVVSRFLTMWLDLNVIISIKAQDAEEHLSQVFRDLLQLFGSGKDFLANIWSVIANSVLVEYRHLKKLEALVLMVLKKMNTIKTLHSSDQYLRMALVINSLTIDNKFDNVSTEALRLRAPKGLDKYLQHHFHEHGWRDHKLEDVKQRLCTRAKRPTSKFFDNLRKLVQKQDVGSLEQRNLFSECLIATEIVRIGAPNAKTIILGATPVPEEIKVEKVDSPPAPPEDIECSNSTESEITKVVGENKPKTLRKSVKRSSSSNESPMTNGIKKRKKTEEITPSKKQTDIPSDTVPTKSQSKEAVVEPVKSKPVKKGWEVMWAAMPTKITTLSIEHVDLSQFQQTKTGSYILKS